MDLITLGKVQGIFGLNGALKIYSWTSPKENIFKYKSWQLDFSEAKNSAESNQTPKQYKLCEGRQHKKGLIAFLEGISTATDAQQMIGAYIKILKSELPILAENEYYWSDLIGLKVFNLDGYLLGKVKELIETGANDCLIVAPCSNSFDVKERVLPYLSPEFIKKIDLDAGSIEIDWDKDF